MPEIRDPERVRDLVRRVAAVAVLGAFDRPDGPAGALVSGLRELGVAAWPVNPRRAGQRFAGRPIAATPDAVGAIVGLVVIARAPLPGDARLVLAMRDRPEAVWLEPPHVGDALVHDLAAGAVDVVCGRSLLAARAAERR